MSRLKTRQPAIQTRPGRPPPRGEPAHPAPGPAPHPDAFPLDRRAFVPARPAPYGSAIIIRRVGIDEAEAHRGDRRHHPAGGPEPGAHVLQMKIHRLRAHAENAADGPGRLAPAGPGQTLAAHPKGRNVGGEAGAWHCFGRQGRGQEVSSFRTARYWQRTPLQRQREVAAAADAVSSSRAAPPPLAGSAPPGSRTGRARRPHCRSPVA